MVLKKFFLSFSVLAMVLPLLHWLDATVKLIRSPSPYFLSPFLPTTVRPFHLSFLSSQTLGKRREMIMKCQSEQMLPLASGRGGR